ncbi:3118_t:CDS:1, partial [Dentiscutata heterogama]
MSTNAFLTGLRSTCSAGRIGYELPELLKKDQYYSTCFRSWSVPFIDTISTNREIYQYVTKAGILGFVIRIVKQTKS